MRMRPSKATVQAFSSRCRTSGNQSRDSCAARVALSERSVASRMQDNSALTARRTSSTGKSARASTRWAVPPAPLTDPVFAMHADDQQLGVLLAAEGGDLACPPAPSGSRRAP